MQKKFPKFYGNFFGHFFWHFFRYEAPALNGWRYEIFGKHAKRLKNGEIAITADKSGIRVIELERE